VVMKLLDGHGTNWWTDNCLMGKALRSRNCGTDCWWTGNYEAFIPRGGGHPI
jgi:hypothetical protein